MRMSRLGAYAVSTTLALSGLTLAVAPARAATHDPVGVDTGSAWLVGQTRNGLLQSGYDDNGTWKLYDDQGLTIDAVESLVEAGEQPAAVQTMTDAVEADAATYASFGPGQAAKMLVLADLAGRDPAAFGTGDLVDQVESKVDTTTGKKGALTEAYGSVISQVYAARALSKAGSAESADVTTFLLRQQCTSGYLRESFASGSDCVERTSAPSIDAPSIDATAVAAIELASVPASPAVSEALTRARTWLAGQQQPDGSWTAFGTGNANATGLAARALGGTAASEKAAKWLYRHQARQGGPTPLATDIGAIAVDDAAYEDGATYGLDERSSTTFTRATAQSVSVLRWLPSSSTGSLVLRAGSGYRKAGSGEVLSVTGTRAGHQLTLTGPGTSESGTATGTSWSRRVTLPRGTSTRTYRVVDDHGHSATRSLKVLGAKRLTIRTSSYRVKRSHLVRVAVSGLASGEKSKVSFKGKVVRRGVASSAGVFRTSFRVGRTRGIKRIRAYGVFSDIRLGGRNIRVVR